MLSWEPERSGRGGARAELRSGAPSTPSPRLGRACAPPRPRSLAPTAHPGDTHPPARRRTPLHWTRTRKKLLQSDSVPVDCEHTKSVASYCNSRRSHLRLHGQVGDARQCKHLIRTYIVNKTSAES
eukprot:1509854-Pleurochrysis_carterae.AAC.1